MKIRLIIILYALLGLTLAFAQASKSNLHVKNSAGVKKAVGKVSLGTSDSFGIPNRTQRVTKSSKTNKSTNGPTRTNFNQPTGKTTASPAKKQKSLAVVKKLTTPSPPRSKVLSTSKTTHKIEQKSTQMKPSHKNTAKPKTVLRKEPAKIENLKTLEFLRGLQTKSIGIAKKNDQISTSNKEKSCHQSSNKKPKYQQDSCEDTLSERRLKTHRPSERESEQIKKSLDKRRLRNDSREHRDPSGRHSNRKSATRSVQDGRGPLYYANQSSSVGGKGNAYETEYWTDQTVDRKENSDRNIADNGVFIHRITLKYKPKHKTSNYRTPQQPQPTPLSHYPQPACYSNQHPCYSQQTQNNLYYYPRHY